MDTTTRTLISAMQMTLDGHVEGPGRQPFEFVDSWADGLALLPRVDTFILGAGMFPEYAQWWNAILETPDVAAEMLGRAPYPREIEYARLAAETPHLVLSTTLQEVAWPTARIIRDLDTIADLKDQSGAAAYVVGGPRLIASLIEAGLLDELRLIVHPRVTPGGTPLFGALSGGRALELVSAAPMTDGRLNLTYRPGAPTLRPPEQNNDPHLMSRS